MIIRYCPVCGKRFKRKTEPAICCSVKCRGLLHRKCKQPAEEELRQLIEEMSVVKIARKYNVSDQAVRKWCKRMGIETKPRGYWAKTYARHPMTGKIMEYPPAETPAAKLSSSMADIERKFAAVATLIY